MFFLKGVKLVIFFGYPSNDAGFIVRPGFLRPKNRATRGTSLAFLPGKLYLRRCRDFISSLAIFISGPEMSIPSPETSIPGPEMDISSPEMEIARLEMKNSRLVKPINTEEPCH